MLRAGDVVAISCLDGAVQVVRLVAAERYGDARPLSDFTMYGSLFLIGAALALAGGAGLFLPPGLRSGVLLALLAGAGVGIAGLALGSPSLAAGDATAWWRVFFVSSIAGFSTVAAGLVVAWRRSRSTDHSSLTRGSKVA